jgi:23S rRNA (uracil-5-)-methyltransferase RumA
MDPARLDSGGPAETAPFVARCRHFGVCGGCARQDLEYDVQLQRKEAELREILGARIPDLDPIVPSSSPWYYRNKMEFAFGFQRKPDAADTPSGEAAPAMLAPGASGARQAPALLAPAMPSASPVAIGLRRRGQFYGVVNLTECYLMSPAVPGVLAAVRDWADRHQLPPYHLRRHNGLLRYVVMREGKRTRELMVILVTAPPGTGPDSPDEAGFTAQLDELGGALKGQGVTSFLWAVTDRQADLAVGPIRRTLFGEPGFEENLAGVRFSLSPYAFFQPNVELAERLILQARGLLGTGWDMLLDLYCGVGGMTMTLSACAKRAIGIELEPAAVADATRNASLNGLVNCQFVAEDSLTFIRRFSNHSFLADRWPVVLDPPRSGMHPKMPAQIMRVAPPVIIYVSCNPKKLAEDLEVFSAAYRVEKATPYDFFPHTPHVEVLVKLVRK